MTKQELINELMKYETINTEEEKANALAFFDYFNEEQLAYRLKREEVWVVHKKNAVKLNGHYLTVGAVIKLGHAKYNNFLAVILEINQVPEEIKVMLDDEEFTKITITSYSIKMIVGVENPDVYASRDRHSKVVDLIQKAKEIHAKYFNQ